MSEVGADRKRQVQELSVFHDVAKALTSSLNLDSVLQTIMQKMAEYFRPDTWSLLMVDETTDELYFAIAVGPAADGDTGAANPRGSRASGDRRAGERGEESSRRNAQTARRH